MNAVSNITFTSMGKWLIITGVLLIIAGLFLHYQGRIPWLGKLPGDFHFKRGNTHFYFPLTSGILLSLLLTLILYIIRMFRS